MSATTSSTQPEHDRLIAAGAAHLAAGRLGEAHEAFLRASQLQPGSASAWRGIGNALHRAGRIVEGGAAHLRALGASAREPDLMRAARAIDAGRFAEAYPLLRDRLAAESDDIAVLRLMALVASATGKHEPAFKMLVRAVELAPDFTDALEMLRETLLLMPSEQALAQVDRQLARRPGHRGYRSLKALLLERAGNHDEAIALHRGILDEVPDHGGSWTALGHVLETVGRSQESIAAYRRSLAIDRTGGEAWWALANIKAFRFEAAEIAAMRALLARTDLPSERRMLTAFALGKAMEDAGAFAASIVHYEEGNQLKRQAQPYDHTQMIDQLARAHTLFTPAFFTARAGQGDPAPDPIFVVGMPRSGSTLVEQILASHSAVEGTMELPDMPRIVIALDAPGGRYPEIIEALDGPALAALAQRYLRDTRSRRKTDKAHFIDKLPANFRHIGLIRTILPNARIIDVRRHPLACGFSCFRQQFATGFEFANDLADIGAYYRAYVAQMALWDAVLPGHVHRIFYERLVADTEGEVRRLLDHLGLPFEAACLRFHENRRSVHTPSASQVRQPIYRGGLDSWQHYEPWLGPLKAALGDVLDCYPEVPPL